MPARPGRFNPRCTNHILPGRAYPAAEGTFLIIAGDSLMGVALIFWENGPEMWRHFLGG